MSRDQYPYDHKLWDKASNFAQSFFYGSVPETLTYEQATALVCHALYHTIKKPKKKKRRLPRSA